MTYKKIFVITLFAVALLAPRALFAEGKAENSDGHSKWKERMEKKVQEVYSQLDLTDEQKKSLDENKSKNHDAKKGEFEKMRALRQQLKDELMKPQLDMDKVNAIHTQIKEGQSRMADERLNSILEVRKILTPEQFAKFHSLMEKEKERRRNMSETPESSK